MVATAVATTGAMQQSSQSGSGGQGRVYVIHSMGGQQQQGPSRLNRVSNAIGQAAASTNLPTGIPRFLGNSTVIIGAWFIAMIFLAIDEWKNNHILPRPARLWSTSFLFGALALATVATPLVPLLNALALGFTTVLIWQYYNGGGQFAQ